MTWIERCIGKTLLLCAVMAASWPLARAQSAPTLLNFQGRLTNAVGAPVTVPTGVRFTLLRGGTAAEAVSTGTAVYQEDATVTPDGNGVFTHVIGTGTEVGGQTLVEEDFDTSGVALFVEMAIGGTPLLPRTRVMSVPYAIEASRVGGLTAQAIIGQSGGNAFANAVVRNGAGLVWQSASAITVKPGTLGFPDGLVRRNTASLTWSLANPVGPLGLDQGTEAANSGYYVYAVPDPNDATMFSAVASTRSPIQVGGLGPVGYGVHRYLGAARNDGASNLLGFSRTGDTVNWFAWTGPWLFRPSQALVTVNAWVSVDASGAVPETGSAVDVTGYYDAWCNAAVVWLLGPTAQFSKFFVGDWQNGAGMGSTSVPVISRTFQYQAQLQSGWSNDSCQYTQFYYSGYVEDLSEF